MEDLIVLKELGEILHHLLTEGERIWEEGRIPSSTAKEAQTQLINIFHPLTEKYFKQWEESRKKIQSKQETELVFKTQGQYLYLPPTEKEAQFVPVMTLDCLFNDRLSRFCSHISFLSVKDKRPYYGVGFRIETPENQNQLPDPNRKVTSPGYHDFYHAQLINKPMEIMGPDGLPDSQPSFPLVANCPITLFLCILLSVYGRKSFRQLVVDLGSTKASQGYEKIKTWYGWKE